MRKISIIVFLILFFALIRSGVSDEMLVDTPEGEKNISFLKVGDYIICLDPEKDFSPETKKIESVEDVEGEEFIEIETEDTVVINVSKKQKIFVPQQKKWVKAYKLKVGEKLLKKDGSELKIKKIKELYEKKRMRYLVVDKHHNFLITKNKILVHNSVFLNRVGQAVTHAAQQLVKAVTTGPIPTDAKDENELDPTDPRTWSAKNLLEHNRKMHQKVMQETQQIDYTVPQIPGDRGARLSVNGKDFIHDGTNWKPLSELTPAEIRSINNIKDIDYSVPQVPGNLGDRRTVNGNTFIATEQGWKKAAELPVAEIKAIDEKRRCQLAHENQAGNNEYSRYNHDDNFNGTRLVITKPVENYNSPYQAKTVQDLIGETTPGPKTGGRSTIHIKPESPSGGIKAANDDFDALKPSGVKNHGNGVRSGTLANGDTVTVRPSSSGTKVPYGKPLGDGEPTLEIQPTNSTTGKKTGDKIKIRYQKDK